MEERERAAAFGPGRVNLIGEHTDYNGGLALPFAIARGVTVRASRLGGELIEAHALTLAERDAFPPLSPERRGGWRAFVRGTAAELARAGFAVPPARIDIEGDVPRGAGLSSSAALEAALSLALLGLRGAEDEIERVELARLCSRVENDWVGARTGLLDQLASLLCRDGHALLIDFSSLALEQVPLELSGWTLATIDSGGAHDNAASGYNARRDECERACSLLGVRSLSEADPRAAAALPEPLALRARHVLEENERVRRAVEALRRGDMPGLGVLLDESHASLRDMFEVSSAGLERAVEAMKSAGAAGARLVGGGFGGSVLGLFPPDARLPRGALVVEPAGGARLL